MPSGSFLNRKNERTDTDAGTFPFLIWPLAWVNSHEIRRGIWLQIRDDDRIVGPSSLPHSSLPANDSWLANSLTGNHLVDSGRWRHTPGHESNRTYRAARISHSRIVRG